MASDLDRQIARARDTKRGYENRIQHLKDQQRGLDRQERDVARLPNAGQVKQQIRDQRRQLQREIDRTKLDVRSCDRQIDELRAIARRASR